MLPSALVGATARLLTFVFARQGTGREQERLPAALSNDLVNDCVRWAPSLRVLVGACA